MLRPSPLDISGLFAGTLEVLKRRLGLFLLIALLPLVVATVLIGAGVAVAVSAGVIAVAGGSGQAIPVGVVLGIALAAVGFLSTLLVQLKSLAMLSVGAYEVAQGGHPDLRGLLARTRGFLPRMAPVIAIGIAAVAVAYASLFVLVAGAIGTAGRGGRGAGAAAGGLILLVVLLFLLVIPLSFIVQTKFLYTIPAIAIEQVGGIDGLKRSWNLTRGAFWRTLGYYLLASMAVAAVGYIVSFASQLLATPMLGGSFNRGSEPAEVVAGLVALIPVYLVLVGMQLVVQLVTTPFLQTYVTFMFVDQVRRSEYPANGYGGMAPAYGYIPGPPASGYPQPGQYNGRPGPHYGQPGYGQPGSYQGQPGPYPGQSGYGQPVQGYPPPGQVPQQGQWPPAGGPGQPPQA